MTVKRSELVSVTLLAALAALVFFISSAVVWLGDDVDYAFFISDSIWDSHGPVDTLSRFFASQGNHYWFVNGRAVAHALVQFFCAIAGQTAFAVCNGLVYAAFVVILALVVGIRRPLAHPAALASIALLALLAFVTKMMPTTQIGFVWMFSLSLLWLWLMRRGSLSRSPLGALALCILAFIAGNGQEALSIGFSAALFFEWCRRPRKGWTTAAAVCYCLGTLALCLSPGTLARAGAISVPFSHSLLYAALSLRAFYALVGVFVWQACFRRSLSLRAFWQSQSFFVVALAVLFAFNFAVGVYSNRQLFGIELVSLLLLFRILPRRRFSAFWIGASAVVVAVMVTAQMIAAREVRRQYDDISRLYLHSSGGIVYYDRTLASVHPFLREFRYYEEILGLFNNDTHHSLQKKLRADTGRRKSVHVWPEMISSRRRVTDTVVEYAPSHYFVILLDSVSRAGSHPRVPVVSSASLFGTVSSDTLVLSRPTVKGRGWKGHLVMPSEPFSSLRGVSLASAP